MSAVLRTVAFCSQNALEWECVAMCVLDVELFEHDASDVPNQKGSSNAAKHIVRILLELDQCIE